MSLLGLDSGIYFRHVVGREMGLLRQCTSIASWFRICRDSHASCSAVQCKQANPPLMYQQGHAPIIEKTAACRAGGVLNCGHAMVRQLIGDSLRHLAVEFCVDGFVFINAETLTQGEL